MRRPRPRLSVRITATFALGALLVSVAVAVSTYVFTERFLISGQQQSALHQAYLNAATVRDRLRVSRSDLPDALDALASGTSAATSSSSRTVIYRSGSWYSSSLAVSRDALPAQLRTEVVGGRPASMFTPIEGRDSLVVGIPLPASSAAFFQVFDLADLSRTLGVLRTVLLAAALVTTAAGAGLGWWASRRLTRPLREVTAAAEQISGGDLDTRLGQVHDADLEGLVTGFNAMVQSLRTRIERDARFAGDVSHELRSPLTTLTTCVGVLEPRRHELSPRGQEALDLLAVEVARFSRLVEDLLEMSRSEAQGSTLVHPEPVAVDQLVRRLVQDPRWSAVPTRVEPAGDCIVQGDRRRLEQAVRNLLENADKHASGATAVTVRAVGEQVLVAVEDCGPGVAEEDRTRVFERFARGSRAGRRGTGGGSGLGLALVAEHARAHDGAAWVEQSGTGGARFVVALPRGRA